MAEKKEGWGHPFSDPDEPEGAAPVADAGTKPAAAEAPTPPAEEPAAPVVAQAGTTPPSGATPAEIRKWKIKGKVAGADKEWEVGEDDFDEAKNPDGYKRLRDRFQKAEDYDRPGGALDQQASKKANETHTRYMIANGFWQIAPDGKSIIEDPRVKAYREWQQAQAAPQNGNGHAQPPAQNGTHPTPRQARLADLEKKYESGDGFTLAEQKEFIKLQNAEERDAERNTESAARAVEQQKQAQMQAETQRESEARAGGERRIKEFVLGLSEKFKHPVTGQVNPIHLKAAERVMTQAAIETQDWAQAEAAVKEFADGHAADLSGLVEQMKTVKTATAPAPPPVHRGGGISPQTPDDKDESKDFDPNKPFQKQKGGFSRFVEAEARRGG